MGFNYFLLNQINKIKKKKSYDFFSIFKNLLLNISKKFPLITIAFILSIILFPLFKIFKIRFLLFQTSRIGHFASSIEYVIKKIISQNTNTFFLIFNEDLVCNTFFLKMIKKYLKHNNKNFIFLPYSYIWQKIINIYKNIFNLEIDFFYDRKSDYNDYHFSSCIFNLSSNEIYLGESLLEELNIPKKAKIICIHNRDSSYLKKHYGINIFDYHNYRDFTLKSMLKALEYFTSQGYYVLRFGSSNLEKVNQYTRNKMIIDYVNYKSRIDFGDIYFNYICDFYFGSESGAWNISRLFRKPGFIINCAPIKSMFCMKWDYPYLIQKIYDKNEKKILSISEIIQRNLIGITDGLYLEEKGLQYIKNTEQEILDLAKEAVNIIQHNRWKKDNNYKTKLDKFHNVVFSSDEMKNRKFKNLLEFNFTNQLKV